MSQLNLGQLPSLIVQRLDQWSIVKVSGPEACSYLQGQLSCDVTSLSPGQHSLAAHCDPKGKLWSVLRLIKLQQDYLFIQPHSVTEIQLQELKKYAVFAKVEISLGSEFHSIAVAGEQASAFINEHYGAQIAQHGGLIDSGICLFIDGPKPRYWLICQDDTILQHAPSTELDANQIWKALQIVAGVPSIEAATSGQFIPQALNLQCSDAISFSKGCYTGQETIARAKYRGTNKRAMWRLAGQGSHLPQAGDDLEIQIGDNWRRKGTVIQGIQLAPNYIELLAVLANDANSEENYRLAGDEDSHFTLAQLPYSLEER